METTDEQRYQQLIQTIASKKEVWLLFAYEGMYAMLDDEEGNQYLPVWPDEKFAKDYAKEDWDGYFPERMGIGEFLSWLDELEEDGIKIAAFPISENQATAQTAKIFKAHILEEKDSAYVK